MQIHAADGNYSSSPVVGNIHELVELENRPNHFNGHTEVPNKPR